MHEGITILCHESTRMKMRIIAKVAMVQVQADPAAAFCARLGKKSAVLLEFAGGLGGYTKWLDLS